MRLALELGLRDYVEKNGFSEVVVGVSGGIDSALTAALAVEALGAERVHCVSMPSRYSSEETRADARLLAESLGTDFRELPIDEIVQAFDGALAASFAGREPDLAEENLQARIRGVLLMALSNKFGWLRGRDREQVGALGRLRDALRRHGRRLRAAEGRLQDRRLPARAAPERARRQGADPASDHRARAERRAARQPARRGLAAALPALDRVLEAYVEQDRSREELSQDGFDPDVVERALALIDRAEYKRRQAPPGVRLTPKAFGRDRRTPITNRWRG